MADVEISQVDTTANGSRLVAFCRKCDERFEGSAETTEVADWATNHRRSHRPKNAAENPEPDVEPKNGSEARP